MHKGGPEADSELDIGAKSGQDGFAEIDRRFLFETITAKTDQSIETVRHLERDCEEARGGRKENLERMEIGGKKESHGGMREVEVDGLKNKGVEPRSSCALEHSQRSFLYHSLPE